MSKTYEWYNEKTGKTVVLSEDLVLRAADLYVSLGWNKIALMKELKYRGVKNYIAVALAAMELAG